jgi:modification methylase
VPLADVRVIEGDARTLPGIDPGSVHLVVTSPPYPMVPQWDAQFAALGARDFGAMHDVLTDAWRAVHRVLVPGGLLAINVGDALRTTPTDGFRLWPNHAEVLGRCRALGFVALPYLLWKKPMNRPNAYLGSGFLPPNAYVTLDCEYILLFRKGALRAFRPGDPERTASRYTRSERDRWFSQLWEVRAARQAGADGRRTGAFPEEIPRRLIRMFSVRGDTVLDPFAGTGTTLTVARALGRRAIGVELDPLRAEALRRGFRDSAEGNGAPAPRPRRA